MKARNPYKTLAGRCLLCLLFFCFTGAVAKLVTTPRNKMVITGKDVYKPSQKNTYSPAPGGPPAISYTSPQVLTAGVNIAPLTPANTGGSVPANAYAYVGKLSGSGQKGFTDGDANTASFNSPQGLAVDAQGNVYVADLDNNVIRKILPDGTTITFAGDGVAGNQNGPANQARFNGPAWVTVDKFGNVYVADTKNFQVRKIDALGQVSVFAGDGLPGYKNGLAAEAEFDALAGLVADAAGNVYVCDNGNHRIRMITPAGVVTTVLGDGAQYTRDGKGEQASIGYPVAITMDTQGNFYVADTYRTIRKVTPAFDATIFAGNSNYGNYDGVGTQASFGGIAAMVCDQTGTLYVTDQYNTLIRRVTADARVSTVAGSSFNYYSNGIGSLAAFEYPCGIATDQKGNIYISEKGNRIRKMAVTGYSIDHDLMPGLNFDPLTGTISGTPALEWPATEYKITAYNESGSSTASVIISVKANSQPVLLPPQIAYDGPKTYRVARPIPNLAPANSGGVISANNYGSVVNIPFKPNIAIWGPYGAKVDADGTIYLADAGTMQIYKVLPDGTRTVLAGRYGGFAGIDGHGEDAVFYHPFGLTLDAAKNVYVADWGIDQIRKITPEGDVTTVAGKNANGYTDGPVATAQFYSVFDVAADAQGNLYVADAGNFAIRKISPDGMVSTLAGGNGKGFADGVGKNAHFRYPTGLICDKEGNVIVVDQENNAIRKITPAGTVTTIAGTGDYGWQDGPAKTATFFMPRAITMDGDGNLYVTDVRNNAVRRISPDGMVTTVAGTGPSTDGINAQIDGVGKAGTVIQPLAIGSDVNGTLYVPTNDGTAMRRIQTKQYIIDKPLPPGLKFDNTTGVISGTPTQKWPATDYTVTGYNASGSSSTVVNIKVDETNIVLNPPAITYNTPLVYTVNQTITAELPTNTGGPVPAGVYSLAGTVANMGFNNPTGVFADEKGGVYIADRDNNLIKYTDKFGFTTIVAGSGAAGAANGPGTTASFKGPSAICMGLDGNLYVADTYNNLIRKITPAGDVSTFAGTGAQGNANLPALAATFNAPVGIVADDFGNIYITEYGGYIRKISPAGDVSNFAGNGADGFNDGQGTAAIFNHPSDIATDAAGNLYVADVGNHLVRQITQGGMVSTVAGNSSGFVSIAGVTVSHSGTVYFSDAGTGKIYYIDKTGTPVVLAGSGSSVDADDIGDKAGFSFPLGLSTGPKGDIYVAGFGGQNIRVISTTGYAIDKALPAGLVFDPQTGKISGTPTTPTPPSDYTITAFNNDGSSSFTINITVTEVALIPQVITFNPLPDKTVGDADFEPGAVSDNSTIPVTYTSDNPAVAQIVGNKVVIVGEGTANITASQAGNAVYSAAQSVTRPLKVNPKQLLAQTITFAPLPAKLTSDADFSPGATSTNSTIPIIYTSDNPAVATIVNGKIVIKGAGTANITASQPGNSDYSAAQPVIRLLEVKDPQIQTITFAPIGTKTYGDAAFAPGATSTNAAIPITYTSNNGAVAVFIDSKIIIKGTGQVTITASQAGNNAYAPALPVSQTFIVQPAILTVKADNKVRPANLPNPLLTVSYSGFVYGEEVSILTRQPVLSTSAVLSSVPGEYPITVNGAEAPNYTPVYINAILAIQPDVKIPNAFTPNGDGVNDTWAIPSLQHYANCVVSIYNRYGEPVFSGRSYAKAWDGTRNGAALPAGIYYYLIDLKDKSAVRSGYVTIIR